MNDLHHNNYDAPTLNCRDPECAFDDAINSGLLSTDENVDNFAGYYMYMYTDERGADYFKNITTRKYISRKVINPTN